MALEHSQHLDIIHDVILIELHGERCPIQVLEKAYDCTDLSSLKDLLLEEASLGLDLEFRFSSHLCQMWLFRD